MIPASECHATRTPIDLPSGIYAGASPIAGDPLIRAIACWYLYHKLHHGTDAQLALALIPFALDPPPPSSRTHRPHPEPIHPPSQQLMHPFHRSQPLKWAGMINGVEICYGKVLCCSRCHIVDIYQFSFLCRRLCRSPFRAGWMGAELGLTYPGVGLAWCVAASLRLTFSSHGSSIFLGEQLG